MSGAATLDQVQELQQKNGELRQENGELRQENGELRGLVVWLRKELFGGGKSETLDRAQLLLKLQELEQQVAAEPPKQTISYERSKPAAEKRPVPAETFAKLPVQETIVILPEAVKAEPEKYVQIGEERTFEVDVVPPKLFKREIVRPKFRSKDRTQAPVVALAPARPVAGGYASAGLLAWIALSKYCDHLPLYRLEQMSARWGAQLPRQSMVDWIRIAAEWLEPIYKTMHAGLIRGGYVQADETPVRCQDPDVKKGQTIEGWMWVISRPGSDVVFDWRLSRRHGEATTLLEGFQGILQSDGYEAYPAFVRANCGVVWVGCWAHARRYFFEALSESPKAVNLVLKLIGRMYRLEKQWDDENVGTARAALRQEHFARILHWLKRVVLGLQRKALPRSQLGKACHYLLGHWEPLTAHLRYSQTRLDNNLVENAIRPSCLGKKNWLFIGHPEAGQRSAILYSIIVSCQRHGKDPLAYLRDVLTRMPTMSNQDDLSALTPKNWQSAKA